MDEQRLKHVSDREELYLPACLHALMAAAEWGAGERTKQAVSHCFFHPEEETTRGKEEMSGEERMERRVWVAFCLPPALAAIPSDTMGVLLSVFLS